MHQSWENGTPLEKNKYTINFQSMGVKLVDIDNCIVFAKNRMKRRNSHTTVTSFFLGREKQKMCFENYFAVHSNKCYLVAHYLQLGLEHP